MQIKNESPREGVSSEQLTANKQNKPKKPSTSSTPADVSTTFARVGKALAMGVLAGPSAALARQVPGLSGSIALPGAGGQVAVNHNVAHATRQLMQASVGCGCGLHVGTAGASTVYAGNNYSNITMDSHTRSNLVVLTAPGSTADIQGFESGDGLTVATSQALDHGLFTTANGAAVVFVPKGATVSGNTVGRYFVNLVGFTQSQIASSGLFENNIAETNLACATEALGASPAAGTALACEAPPSPTPPPAPMPPPPSPTPVVFSPPPPSPVPTPKPASPPPSPTPNPMSPPPSPTPVVFSPPPPSPVPTPKPASPPPSPTPVAFSPPPPSPTPTPTPTPTPSPNPNPAPSPHSGGGGAGAAIGGIAGGAVAATVAGGAYYLHRRRKAREQEAGLREQNVEMGAPTPAPAAGQAGAPEQDFQYTV